MRAKGCDILRQNAVQSVRNRDVLRSDHRPKTRFQILQRRIYRCPVDTGRQGKTVVSKGRWLPSQRGMQCRLMAKTQYPTFLCIAFTQHPIQHDARQARKGVSQNTHLRAVFYFVLTLQRGYIFGQQRRIDFGQNNLCIRGLKWADGQGRTIPRPQTLQARDTQQRLRPNRACGVELPT